MKTLAFLCGVLCSFVGMLSAEASGMARLKSFLNETQRFEATFSQQVYGKKNQKIQSGQGTLALMRPGKFRWNYTQPSPQLMIGDGQQLWIYDQELAQVTVRGQKKSLGSSPAALLAGNTHPEHNYLLQDLPDSNGLEWVQARPKQSSETGFETVKIGFNSHNQPVEMILKDFFGQTTTIRFNAQKMNPTLSDSLFQFTPPKGADVIRE